MGDQIYLHIGAPKTGAAYLQRCLLLNRTQLAAQGLLVPQAGAIHLNHAISKTTAPDAMVIHHPVAWKCQIERQGEFSPEIQEITECFETAFDKEFKASLCYAAIFSSECFYWELRTIGMIRALRRLFADHSVRILFYARNPFVFFESMYAHAIIDYQYQGNAARFFQDNADQLNYDRGLAPWIEIFGADNVQLIHFEQADQVGLFHSLMHACEVEETDTLIVPEGSSEGMQHIGVDLFTAYMGQYMMDQHILPMEQIRTLLAGSKRRAAPSLQARLLDDSSIDLLRKALLSREQTIVSRAILDVWMTQLESFQARPIIADLGLSSLTPMLANFCSNAFRNGYSIGAADARHELEQDLTQARNDLVFRGQKVDQARALLHEQTQKLEALYAAAEQTTQILSQTLLNNSSNTP